MSHYCDPILAAGYRWCPQCRTESFPVDATWLGTDLILATFGLALSAAHVGLVFGLTLLALWKT